MTATAFLVPWYWRWVQWLQGVIDTRPKQYIASVALPVGFLVAVFLIYLGGKPLKRRFTPELVEIARTLTIMGVALVDAVLFVVIWRRFGETITELDDFGTRLVPGTETAVNLYIAFITLLGTYMLTRVTKRVIRYWSESGRISPHQRELAHHLVQIVLFLIISLFIFGLFGLDPADLFLGAGVLGVVLGLAARQTLGNVLSGLVILFGRPFEAGDWITVGEQEGIVTDITVFNTQVRTFNEEHLLIPNDVITETQVINYSKTERLRLTTEVGIDYGDDVSKAASIAKTTMERCDTVTESPSPDVIIDSFGDSSVVLELRYWIDRPTIQRKLSAQNEVIEAVKSAFESEDIKIPFPQRELMGRAETDGLEISTDHDGSVDERFERAVRPASEGETDDGTMVVREPVQAEYGGSGAREGESESDTDGEPEGEAAEQPDDGAGDEPDESEPYGGSGEPVEEPVEEEYGDDGQPDDEDDADDEHDIDSAAQLVEDEADVSSPHPRETNDDFYPAGWDDTSSDDDRPGIQDILDSIDSDDDDDEDRSGIQDIFDSISPGDDGDGDDADEDDDADDGGTNR